MCVYGLRVGETLTPVDNHLDLVEDIQRRLKKQEKYRAPCSAVTGSNTARAAILAALRMAPDAKR